MDIASWESNSSFIGEDGMEIYDVTVARVGVMRVIASSKLEAKEIVNKPESKGKIEWSDDWAVTDVEEADPFGTLGIRT